MLRKAVQMGFIVNDVEKCTSAYLSDPEIVAQRLPLEFPFVLRYIY
jgi:hypothetical protein